jgi:hypothetical protein
MRPALMLEMPKDSRKREPQTDDASRSRGLEDEGKSREGDRNKDIGISTDYLRSLERQIKSDKK